jgi:hypothetical protein
MAISCLLIRTTKSEACLFFVWKCRHRYTRLERGHCKHDFVCRIGPGDHKPRGCSTTYAVSRQAQYVVLSQYNVLCLSSDSFWQTLKYFELSIISQTAFGVSIFHRSLVHSSRASCRPRCNPPNWPTTIDLSDADKCLSSDSNSQMSNYFKLLITSQTAFGILIIYQSLLPYPLHPVAPVPIKHTGKQTQWHLH